MFEQIFSFAIGALALFSSAPPSLPERGPDPLDASWVDCEAFQGSTICSYEVTEQEGDRVCGIRRYFATNRYYWLRYVAKVEGDIARFEKICGDPGSDTDTYCAGQAPASAVRVGWGTSDELIAACHGGRIDAESGKAVGCASTTPSAPVRPGKDWAARVHDLDAKGPDGENRDWLKRCVAGSDD